MSFQTKDPSPREIKSTPIGRAFLKHFEEFNDVFKSGPINEPDFNPDEILAPREEAA